MRERLLAPVVPLAAYRLIRDLARASRREDKPSPERVEELLQVIHDHAGGRSGPFEGRSRPGPGDPRSE